MTLAGFAPGRAFPALPFAILLSRRSNRLGKVMASGSRRPGVFGRCFWTAICPASDAVADDEPFWLGLKSKPRHRDWPEDCFEFRWTVD
jgi:hypothetical protein